MSQNASTSPRSTSASPVQAVGGLNATESKDIYLKIRTTQNILAVDTYCCLDAAKLQELNNISVRGRAHGTTTYVTADSVNARGVFYGLPASVLNEQLQDIIEIEQAKPLTVRRVGYSNNVMVVVEGPCLPRFALINHVVQSLYSFRHIYLVCMHCFLLEDGTDVCTTRATFRTCSNCSKTFPSGQDISPHECFPYCRNRSGENSPALNDA